MASNQIPALALRHTCSVSVVEHVAAMLEFGLFRAAHEEDTGDDERDNGTQHHEPTRQEKYLADVKNPHLRFQSRGLTHKDAPRRPQLFEL